MFPVKARGLILAYFLLSLGGFLLHIRIHPPGEALFNVIPAVFAGLNAFVIPFVLGNPKLCSWGVLFAWVTAVTGTVTMAYFSMTNWYGDVTVVRLILYSTLPDILILWVRVPVAQAIHHLTAETHEKQERCSA